MDILPHAYLYCLFEKMENKLKEAEDGPLKTIYKEQIKWLPTLLQRIPSRSGEYLPFERRRQYEHHDSRVPREKKQLVWGIILPAFDRLAKKEVAHFTFKAHLHDDENATFLN